MTSETHLEQAFWVANDVEKSPPSRYFCFPSATDHNIQCNVKVVQEFYHSGECIGCCVRCVTLLCFRCCLRLYYGVEEDLESMSKKH